MKDIKGYEGLYAVTEDGRVWSYPKKDGINNNGLWMHPSIVNGYRRLKLMINGKIYTNSIHRLVAEAYIPNPHRKPQINHKDANKGNNNVDNLEWVTPKENKEHATSLGLTPSGENHGRAKLTKEEVIDIKLLYKTHYKKGNKSRKYSRRGLAKLFSISDGTIGDIIKGRSWKFN